MFRQRNTQWIVVGSNLYWMDLSKAWYYINIGNIQYGTPGKKLNIKYYYQYFVSDLLLGRFWKQFFKFDLSFYFYPTNVLFKMVLFLLFELYFLSSHPHVRMYQKGLTERKRQFHFHFHFRFFFCFSIAWPFVYISLTRLFGINQLKSFYL